MMSSKFDSLAELIRPKALRCTIAIRGALWVALLLCATVAIPTHAKEDDGDPVTAAIGQVVQARESVRGYVTDIASQYKATDTKYLKAKDLYGAAVGSYTSWTGAVTDAILAGNLKKLNRDAGYRTISAKASVDALAFTEYVQSVRASTKDLSILGALADVGLKIWNGVRESVRADRKARADNFSATTRWERWDDIVTPSKKSATAAN
jgi:hypothetical protein